MKASMDEMIAAVERAAQNCEIERDVVPLQEARRALMVLKKRIAAAQDQAEGHDWSHLFPVTVNQV